MIFRYSIFIYISDISNDDIWIQTWIYTSDINPCVFCSNDSNGETTDGQQFTELLMDCPEPKKWMCFVFDGFCMFFLLIQK